MEKLCVEKKMEKFAQKCCGICLREMENGKETEQNAESVCGHVA